MAILKTKSPDVMCAAAGLNRTNTGCKPIRKIQQSMPLEALAKYHRSCCVQPGKTANDLAQINVQNLDGH